MNGIRPKAIFNRARMGYTDKDVMRLAHLLVKASTLTDDETIEALWLVEAK
jgi:hypothetical protein